jgi:thiamine kinase-like enzyme
MIYRKENRYNITPSSDDSHNISDNRLRMKRRRSNTKDFKIKVHNDVSYGNFLEDPAENMLDDVFVYT